MVKAAVPIARSPALALTAHPDVGGSTSLTSAPVAAEAMYQSLSVDAREASGYVDEARVALPMFHCSAESAHHTMIAALLRVRPAYTNDGFPLLLETSGFLVSTYTPFTSSSPAPDITTTRASLSCLGLELVPPIGVDCPVLRRHRRAVMAKVMSL